MPVPHAPLAGGITVPPTSFWWHPGAACQRRQRRRLRRRRIVRTADSRPARAGPYAGRSAAKRPWAAAQNNDQHDRGRNALHHIHCPMSRFPFYSGVLLAGKRSWPPGAVKNARYSALPYPIMRQCSPMFPSVYVPHGGGPCFFMETQTASGLAWAGSCANYRLRCHERRAHPDRVRTLGDARIRATGAERPPLIFDYYGFPPLPNQLRYDARVRRPRGARAGAAGSAGSRPSIDRERGLDHGVFRTAEGRFSGRDIPVVELCAGCRPRRGAAPACRTGAGAIACRGGAAGGCGMSFHNLRALGDPRLTTPSAQFDAWLTASACAPASCAASSCTLA